MLIGQLDTFRKRGLLQPVGERQFNGGFQRQRHDREAPQRLTQEGQRVLTSFRASGIQDDAPAREVDPDVLTAFLDKRTRNQRLKHFVFDAVALGLLRLALETLFKACIAFVQLTFERSCRDKLSLTMVSSTSLVRWKMSGIQEPSSWPSQNSQHVLAKSFSPYGEKANGIMQFQRLESVQDIP